MFYKYNSFVLSFYLSIWLQWRRSVRLSVLLSEVPASAAAICFWFFFLLTPALQAFRQLTIWYGSRNILNNTAAKTLLVCADSDAEKSKRACYIGTDNVAAGKQAAELLKAALPQGGKIILFVGYANAQNTKERIQGIQNGLAGANIQIMDTLADGAKSVLALNNAQDALAKYPDLAGMVGIYGYHGPAILTAVRGAGKAGRVKIVCFDDESATLAGIAAGDIYGTLVQKPLEIGWQTIVRMDKYLRGDKTQLAGGKILITSRPVTKDEVGEFQAGQRGLLSHLQDERP